MNCGRGDPYGAMLHVSATYGTTQKRYLFASYFAIYFTMFGYDICKFKHSREGEMDGQFCRAGPNGSTGGCNGQNEMDKAGHRP